MQQQDFCGIFQIRHEGKKQTSAAVNKRATPWFGVLTLFVCFFPAESWCSPETSDFYETLKGQINTGCVILTPQDYFYADVGHTKPVCVFATPAFCPACPALQLNCINCTVALIKISIYSKIGPASGKSSSLVLVLLSLTQKGATTVMASRRAGNTPTQPVVYKVKLIQDRLLPATTKSAYSNNFWVVDWFILKNKKQFSQN